MDGGDARGSVVNGGTDLSSIPGVGRVAVRVEEADVRVRLARRPRIRPAVAALAALILLPAAWSVTLGQQREATAAPEDTAIRSLDEAGDGRAGAAGAATAEAAVAPAVEPPPAFARFDDLVLHLPADDVVLVGFHEASFDDALALTPSGQVAANENTTKFSPPAPVDGGPRYVVLSSRGRPNAATSAVDLVMRDDVAVRSVVSGTVTDVSHYDLYSKHPDSRIEIQPLDRPDLRVVLIHVTGVAVRPGDEVVAGETVLAEGPNRFPFSSHIDRYTEPDRWPHVHLELKRADRAS